jgi:transposase InsO family protein
VIATSAFIDQERERFCVELICDTLGVSVSAYYARRGSPPSARAIEDARLLTRIRELHAANYCAYGYRRMWKALGRTGEDVGRDRVKRLMAANDIQGAKRRGKPWRTTTPDPAAHRAPDLVQRTFSATRPDTLWLADSPTSRPTGEETRKRTGGNTDTAPRPLHIPASGHHVGLILCRIEPRLRPCGSAPAGSAPPGP